MCEGEKTDPGLEWQGEIVSLSHLEGKGSSRHCCTISQERVQASWRWVPQPRGARTFCLLDIPLPSFVGTVNLRQELLIGAWVTHSPCCLLLQHLFLLPRPLPRLWYQVCSDSLMLQSLSKSNFLEPRQLELIKLTLMKLELSRQKVSRMKMSAYLHLSQTQLLVLLPPPPIMANVIKWLISSLCRLQMLQMCRKVCLWPFEADNTSPEACAGLPAMHPNTALAGAGKVALGGTEHGRGRRGRFCVWGMADRAEKWSSSQMLYSIAFFSI